MQTFRRLTGSLILGACLVAGPATLAHAEEFVSPFVGYNFAGDAGCHTITGCSDKRLNVGVGLALTGDLFGVEEELAYAKDFFGKAPGLESSVLTFMGNFMVAPKLDSVRPYGVIGLGLVRAHVARPFAVSDSNNFGWDAGGGLIVYLGDHFGVRGDIRYIHAFQDFDPLGVAAGNNKLDFGRASAGVLLRF